MHSCVNRPKPDMCWKQGLEGVTGPPLERPDTPCFFWRREAKKANKIPSGRNWSSCRAASHAMFFLQIEAKNATKIPSERDWPSCRAASHAMFVFCRGKPKTVLKFRAHENGAFCTCQCISGGRLGQKLCLRKECPQRKLCVEFKSSPCRNFVRFRSVQCQWHR